MKIRPACPYCIKSPPSAIAKAGCGRVCKFGFFSRKGRRTRFQRYRCMACKKLFSEATFRKEYRQKKRHLNQLMFKALTSGSSLRQTARCLNLSYKTVASRLPYFESVSRAYHEEFLKKVTPEGGFTKIQFDDMETSEHTKLKPLSLPITVEASQRYILFFDAVSMPAKGHLAKISRKKYGPRADHRPIGWNTVLGATARVAAKNATITSDSHKRYPFFLKSHIPKCVHIRTPSRKACVVGQGELKRGGHDPLFSFNHTAAMHRAHINRLFRRTWCTTKRPDRLKSHMAMYSMWHNELILAKIEGRKYKLPFRV